MKKKLLSIILSVFMLILSISILPFTVSAADGDTYSLVTSTDQLEAGKQYLIVCPSKSMAMSAQNGTYRNGVIVTITDDKITTSDAQVVTLGGATGAWTLGVSDTEYLTYSGSKNTLTTGTTADTWTIAIDSNNAIIKHGTSTTRQLQWNASSPRFACYTSSQTAIALFKLDETTGGGEQTPSCEHTNTEILAAVAATCTTTGLTEGEKCTDCGETVTAQETIPATGHNYVDGVCSGCDEEQPTTLTINRDAFGDDVGSYNWYDWTATITTGESITGFGYITNNTTAIQVNGGKTGDYIYNTIALPGKIVSVTLTKASGTDRNFDVLTSDTLFDSATKASLKGEATDAEKLVTTEGVTWTFTTNHKYFAIVITDSSAAYLSSIEIAYEVCAHTNREAIGEAKEATCTEDGITAGEKCKDCGEVLKKQETIPATGHTDVNPADSKCDTCGANLCTEHVWVDGEVITPATCTATGLQAQVCQNCEEPGEDKVLDKVAHTPETDEAVAATCTATGLTEGSHCSVCSEVLVAQTVVEMIDHTYVDGVCSVCGDIVVAGDQLADFQFGANGEAAHKDGDASKLQEVCTSDEGHILEPTTATNVYGGAFDAKGNSALKLGTGSKAATLAFEVKGNVKQVVLYVAGYKANTAKINVNGTEYTIESKSGEGNYTKIVVDTKTNKTVTLTTLSGGYRAMIDSIQFWGETVGKINGYTVTLGDNIGVNFYMELTEETLADETAYMSFTLPNGNIEKVYVKDVDESNGLYKFTCNVAVKEMADAITGQLVTANGDSAVYTYSVKQYATYIINTPESYSANEIALAKALLNYGAYAQTMFDYKTDALANNELAEGDKDVAAATVAEEYAKEVTAGIDGVTYLGTSTMWETDMAIRHYFDITGENVTFKLYAANGDFIKDLTAVDSDNGKYVAIDGIVAKDMAISYKLVVSNGTSEQTITYSVYSYFYDILNSESYSEAEKNAMKAAYLYAEAATTYLAEK